MKKNKKMPIYCATRSLKTRYSFSDSKEDAEIVLTGDKTHAILYTAYTALLSIRTNMKYDNGNPVYDVTKNSLKSTNFATAKMTILFTDTDTDEGLGEEIETKSFYINIGHQSDRILSCNDLYDEQYNYDQKGITASKKARNSDFNNVLKQNIVNFSQVAECYNIPLGTVKTADDFKSAVASPMFHENFHHTEQGVMYYLCNAGLKDIVSLASKSKAAYFYGLVLDLYTKRMLCCNCNACLVGMQHSQKAGFLADLSKALKKKGIQSRINKNPMLSIRVSASKAPKGFNLDALQLAEDKGIVHEYNPDKTTKIFQAENRALGTQKIANDQKLSLSDYPGTIFVSKTFSKKKLEEHIRFHP
jgi:hypothetical protein